jgi:hypothetical protein
MSNRDPIIFSVKAIADLPLTLRYRGSGLYTVPENKKNWKTTKIEDWLVREVNKKKILVDSFIFWEEYEEDIEKYAEGPVDTESEIDAVYLHGFTVDPESGLKTYKFDTSASFLRNYKPVFDFTVNESDFKRKCQSRADAYMTALETSIKLIEDILQEQVTEFDEIVIDTVRLSVEGNDGISLSAIYSPDGKEQLIFDLSKLGEDILLEFAQNESKDIKVQIAEDQTVPKSIISLLLNDKDETIRKKAEENLVMRLSKGA